MHIILLSPPPPSCRAQKCLKNARRQPFGGLKRTTAQALFTLRVKVSPAWRGEEKKKANSKEDRSCSRARGGVGKSGTTRAFATQTARLTAMWYSSPHAFMNLLPACHYGYMLSQETAREEEERVPRHEVVSRSEVAASFISCLLSRELSLVVYI